MIVLPETVYEPVSVVWLVPDSVQLQFEPALVQVAVLPLAAPEFSEEARSLQVAPMGRQLVGTPTATDDELLVEFE